MKELGTKNIGQPLSGNQDGNSWQLLDLLPTVNNDDARMYVDEIRKGVDDPRIKNIAVSGSYGSGKSSILEQFAREIEYEGRFKIKKTHKIKKISFLTISAQDVECVGAEATKEKSNSMEDKSSLAGDNSSVSARQGTGSIKEKNMRRVQSDFFRQLYFGEQPNKLKASRYTRIGRGLNTLRKLLISLTAECIILFAMIIPRDTNYYYTNRFAIALLAAATFAGIFLLVDFISNQFYSGRIKRFEFKDLSLDLLDGELDFEQLIDEILYVFRESKYDVVIIEDLDRFNDPEIFEALHQLNTMVNEHMATIKKGKPVTFVYALRDSLIVNPANRAKLFDLVVPVIPFLAQNNSIDFLVNVFQGVGFDTEHEATSKILNIIASVNCDMRTIKMIRNSALNMRIVLKAKLPSMEDAKIIAMAAIRELYPVVYENYLNDFGLIKDLRVACIKNRDEQIKQYRENHGLEHLAQEAGERLWRWLSDEVRKSYAQAEVVGITIGDDEYDEESIQNSTPWIMYILEGEEEISVRWRGQYGGIEQSSFSMTTIRDLDFTSEIQEAYSNKEFVSGVNKLDEIRYADPFTFSAKISPADIKLDDDTREFLFIKQLAKVGIIDNGFYMYIAPFVGVTESSELYNFINNCVRPDMSDVYFKLDKKDVSQLLDKLNPKQKKSAAMVNFSIIEYLIENNDVDMVYSIFEKRGAEESMNFLKELISINRKLISEISLRKTSHINHEDRNKKKIEAVTECICRLYPVDAMRLAKNIDSDDITAFLLTLAVKMKTVKAICNSPLLNAGDMKFLCSHIDLITSIEGKEASIGIFVNKQFPATDIQKIISSGADRNNLKKLIDEGFIELNKLNLEMLSDEELIEYISREDVLLDKAQLIQVLTDNSAKHIGARKVLVNNINKHIDDEDQNDIRDDDVDKAFLQTIFRDKIKTPISNIQALINEKHAMDIVRILTNIDDGELPEIMEALKGLGGDYAKLTEVGKRPTLVDNKYNRRLLRKLEKAGIVNLHNVQGDPNKIRAVVIAKAHS